MTAAPRSPRRAPAPPHPALGCPAGWEGLWVPQGEEGQGWAGVHVPRDPRCPHAPAGTLQQPLMYQGHGMWLFLPAPEMPSAPSSSSLLGMSPCHTGVQTSPFPAPRRDLPTLGTSGLVPTAPSPLGAGETPWLEPSSCPPPGTAGGVTNPLGWWVLVDPVSGGNFSWGGGGQRDTQVLPGPWWGWHPPTPSWSPPGPFPVPSWSPCHGCHGSATQLSSFLSLLSAGGGEWEPSR